MSDITLEGVREFKFSVLGLARVEDAIKGLSEIQKNKAIISGYRAMGSVFIAGGKQRLRSRLSGKGKGNLIKSFKIRVKRDNGGVLVGFNKRGHIAHIVDMGTVQRNTRHGHLNRSKVPANNSWHETAEQDFPKAAEKLFTGIETAVKRIIYK